jgi:hypothetical protein
MDRARELQGVHKHEGVLGELDLISACKKMYCTVLYCSNETVNTDQAAKFSVITYFIQHKLQDCSALAFA